MRNLGFGLAVAAAVIGGTAIGAYGDLGVVTALFAAKTDGPTARSGHDPLAGLDFVIDSTRAARTTKVSPNASRDLAAAAEDTPQCPMPRAGDAEVVLFGVYEGQTLSTVALGSRDEVTQVIEVVIEPGPTPLYLVFSAYEALIWRFSGATERVERVVLVAGGKATPRSWTALAGAVGLDPAVVTTAPYTRCFKHVYEPGTPQAAWVAAVVRRATGKVPSVIAGHYDPAAVRLPSGLVAKANYERRPVPSGFDSGQWSGLLQFSPGGLTRVEAATVVSDAAVIDYDVLPQQAGLAQLVGFGALVSTPDGLKIVKPIARFPAGLAGAHSTAFILAEGVPLPAGDPGHSCVRMETTGRSPSALQGRSICDM